jgi:hypothetical protein
VQSFQVLDPGNGLCMLHFEKKNQKELILVVNFLYDDVKSLTLTLTALGGCVHTLTGPITQKGLSLLMIIAAPIADFA